MTDLNKLRITNLLTSNTRKWSVGRALEVHLCCRNPDEVYTWDESRYNLKCRANGIVNDYGPYANAVRNVWQLFVVANSIYFH